MKEEFIKYILQKKLFTKEDKILAAVSSGIDSVVMLHLLLESGYKVGVAHCNFGLRGKESDDDEKFVKALAINRKAPFYSVRFDTDEIAMQKGVSIQMAARDLRYEWLEKIRKEKKYKLIAVAHHADDSIETFFINLIRGTGIAGLRGIKAVSEKIVRPLLFASRNEIIEFAKKNKIKFREDSSNASDKYLRNKIRHHLVPLLEEMNPSVKDAVIKAAERINCTEEIMQKLVHEARKKMIKEKNGIVSIDIDQLSTLQFPELFLYDFVKPYGFMGDVVNQMMDSLHAEPGKIFYSSTHRIVRDREYFFLEAFEKKSVKQEYKIPEHMKMMENPLKMTFVVKRYNKQFSIPRHPSFAVFDFAKIEFPLVLRKWKVGDSFHPFGMKGKKKLSDFFTDIKLSLPEKEKVWLLCSRKNIIWVVGYRIDDRYRVSDTTRKIMITRASF